MLLESSKIVLSLIKICFPKSFYEWYIKNNKNEIHWPNIGVFWYCLCLRSPRCTVIYPGYIVPGYFSELSSMKYTAQFKNFTTARMHWHMPGTHVWAQGRSQPHSPGWARVPLSSFFPQILINLSYFSSNFTHFLPHFGSPGGRLAHPGRPWLRHCMGFNGISESFFHQDTIRSIILFTMYYITSFYCNKYLFIPTLHGNLKFHNYSIHTIPNTALLGVFHGEPPNSQQTLTFDNFLFLIDLSIQHSPD